MNSEVLQESLQMAVRQAFILEADAQEEIQQELTGFTKRGLEEILCITALNCQTGLKRDIVLAYTSGDLDEIVRAEKQALNQAETAFRRRTAQKLLTNDTKNSRIEADKRKKWNKYGYSL